MAMASGIGMIGMMIRKVLYLLISLAKINL
nr:MAG TPA: hypothetical protein [Bacteriophage sp.]